MDLISKAGVPANAAATQATVASVERHVNHAGAGRSDFHCGPTIQHHQKPSTSSSECSSGRAETKLKRYHQGPTGGSPALVCPDPLHQLAALQVPAVQPALGVPTQAAAAVRRHTE